jgi:hypothetical protein
MNLDQQLKILIDEAPQYGVPAVAMQRAIAPVLKAFANQLQHLQYFVCQTPEQDWIVTTLSHRDRPQQEKQVIYAFPTYLDAANSQGASDSPLQVAALPVTHLLFQLLAMEPVDSLIFLEIPDNLEKGTEIERSHLQALVQQQLQQLTPPSTPSNIPPHWA